MSAVVSRFLGFLLLAAMLSAIVIDCAKSIAASSPTVTSVGQWWFAFDRASLDAFRQSVETTAGGWLWESVFQTLLSLPLWLALGVPGAVLIALTPTVRRQRAGFARRDGGLP
jgi:ABC-type spermidine/putrescine transport system permease subunit I